MISCFKQTVPIVCQKKDDMAVPTGAAHVMRNEMIEEKIELWIIKYGKLSIPFLQMKLKISFEEAQKMLKSVNKQIETCQNGSD